MTHNSKTSNWISFFIILMLVIVSRLPQILSPLFYPDGDECVIGIMAKHFIEGKAFPVYFYGQNYGFSLLEVIPVAISFKLFGVSAYAVKITMLPFWAAGIFLMLKAFKKMGGIYAAWLIVLFMISMPAWAAWSMKARGGYTTAFLFTAWLLYLIVKHVDADKKRLWQFILPGILLAIIFRSQQLWLPGIAPFLAYYIIKRKAYIHSFALLGAFAIGCLSIALLSMITPTTDWWHPQFAGNYIRLSLPLLYDRVHEMLLGSYNFFRTVDLGVYSDRASEWWMGAGFLFTAIQLIRLLTRRYFIYSHLFFIGAALTLSYTLFANPIYYGARHLLPLAQLLAGGLALELAVFFRQGILLKVPAFAYAFILILFSIQATLDFDKMDEGTSEAPEGHSRLADAKVFIQKLNSLNVHHFVCYTSLLEWQIDFLSDEKLIGANIFYGGRYQPYRDSVEKANKTHKPITVIGTKWEIEHYVLKHLSKEQRNHVFSVSYDLNAFLYYDEKQLRSLYELKR